MEALRAPTSEMALRLTLDGLESRLEEVSRAYADAQWRRHFRRTGDDELARLEASRALLLLDDQMRDILQRWASGSRDPLLARRMTLLLRGFGWAEIESQPQVYRLRNRIDRSIVGFRPQIAGASMTRVERSEILRRERDRERRRDAWLAMGPLAARIEPDLRRLMRLRQGLARELGYDSFVSWALDKVGLSLQWVEAFLGELLRLTAAPYGAWLREVTQRLALPDGLRPWDLTYAANEGMRVPEAAFPRDGLLPAVQSAAEGLGLGQAAAGVRVDVADIPYAALCYAVRPPDDVRILLSPRDGRAHYDILFHEFGHALHWRCLRPMTPILQRESPPFSEAMACLWERLVSEPDWLMEREGVEPDHVAHYRLRWVERTIYRLRALIAQATFEYRAYQALDSDLLTLFRDTYSECLEVPFDQAPGWADNPFWTSHPVYVQNYVIGEAVASQALAALKRRFGRLIGKPQVGAWLVEHFYAPGASLPWPDKLVRATGATLSSRELASDLGCNM